MRVEQGHREKMYNGTYTGTRSRAESGFGGKKGGENIISRVESDKVRFEDV